MRHAVTVALFAGISGLALLLAGSPIGLLLGAVIAVVLAFIAMFLFQGLSVAKG